VILVDTSVWVEVFRKRNPLDLEQFVDFDEVATCLPIVESPLGSHVIEEAVGLYRAARRVGVTIRSSVDCLIAACALRHDLTVLHRDRDYPSLGRVSPLRSRSLA